MVILLVGQFAIGRSPSLPSERVVVLRLQFLLQYFFGGEDGRVNHQNAVGLRFGDVGVVAFRDFLHFLAFLLLAHLG